MTRGLSKKRGKSLRAHVEPLENRKLLSATLSVSSNKTTVGNLQNSTVTRTSVTDNMVVAKPADQTVTGPSLTLVNPNAVPGSSTMVFNRIQNPNATLGDTVHDTGKLLVTNSGTQPLIISSYSLSTGWILVNAPSFPLTVAVGATQTISIKFTASNGGSPPYNQSTNPDYSNVGGVRTGTIALHTNDPSNSSATVALNGYWQLQSENSDEPSLQTIVNLLEGWNTNINSTPIPDLTESSSTNNSSPTYYGEEVVSPYWKEADTSKSVSVQQLAAYHTEGETTITRWFVKGSSTLTELYRTDTNNGQTLFPYATGTTTPATGSFSTTSAFGFNIDGESSDDSKNTALKTGGGHHVRFYPVRDSSGNLVPNTYIMAIDYSGNPQNFDFQDNVYVISNIRPATGTAAPASVSAVGQQGSNSLSWSAVQDSTLKGYNVYRSSSINGTYSLLTSTPVTTTSYLDSTAPTGVVSYYRITAVDNAGATESLGTGASATATSTAPVTPATPGNFTATGVTNAVSLSWSAVSDPTLAGYKIYRSASATGSFTLLTSSPITATSYTDSTAPVGQTEYYQVTAIDANSGLESSPATANAAAVAPVTGLVSTDIGATPSGSTTVVTTGTDFDVTAGGPGVANNADGFRFIYQSQTGDFDMKVQVLSITVAGNYSTAGIMARSTLDTTSPDVYMSASPVNYRFKDRTTISGVNALTTGGSTAYPNVWVRLSRVGNVFTGYTSSDGSSWTQVSSITLALPTTLSLGLAVASNNNTQTTTAQLRNYSTTVTQPPAWLSPGDGAAYTYAGSTLTVTSGTVSIASDPSATTANVSIVASGTSSVQFQSTAKIGSLTLNNTSSAILTGSGHTLVVASLAISSNSKLDLQTNSMVIDYAGATNPQSTVVGYLKSGLTTSEGSGLVTSSGPTQRVTTLAMLDNGDLTSQGRGMTTFGRVGVDSTSLLIKYTYFGDANFDGKVDGTDYSRIDNGFITQGTNWYNGDFNFDGMVNGSDYTLIDNAYNTQGATLAAQVAAQSAVSNSPGVARTTVAQPSRPSGSTVDAWFSQKKKAKFFFDD